MKRISKSEYTWAFLFLVVTQIPFWAADYAFFPTHDAQFAFQIFQNAYREFFFYGELPLWRPFDSFGLPSDLYHLFSLSLAQYAVIPVLSWAGLHNSFNAFRLSMVFEVLILLTGTMFVARLHIRSTAARILVYGLTLATVAWGVQIWWNFRIYYFLPLLLYYVEMFFRSGRLGYVAAAGAVYIGTMFGSIPYYLPLHASVVVVFSAIMAYTHGLPKKILRPRWPDWTAAGLCLILSLLYLGLLLKSRDGLFNSSPFRDPKNLNIGLQNFLTHAGAQGDPSTLWEYIFGVPTCFDISVFIGVIALIFAGMAFVASKSQRAILPFAGCALFLVFISCLQSSFVAPMFYFFFPLGNMIRHVSYFKVLAKPLLIILAGFGADAVLENGSHRRVHFGLLVSTLVALVPLAAYLASGGKPPYERLYTFDTFPIVTLVCLCLAALYFGRIVVWREKISGALIVSLVLLEAFSFTYAYRYNAKDTHFDLGKAELKRLIEPVSVQPLKFVGQRSFSFDFSLSPIFSDFYPITPSTLNFDLCHFYSKHGRLDWLTESVKNLLHARYGDAMGLQTKIESDTAMQSAMGCNTSKLLLFRQYKQYTTEADAVSYIKNSQDFGRIPVIETGGDTFAINPVPGESDSYQLSKFSSNRLTLDLKASSPGWLIYADAFHENWTATIDDQAVPIRRANLAFKAVLVPEGVHKVEFRYLGNPMSKLILTSLLILGALFALGLPVLIFAATKVNFQK
jgi:hypothetical protein